MSRLVVLCCGQPCRLPQFLDLRGLLSFWLLWELRPAPQKGAELAARLRWRRGSTLSPGTYYPALSGLEAAGLVRKRVVGRDSEYEITRQGERELECARDYLRTLFHDVVPRAPERKKAARPGGARATASA